MDRKRFRQDGIGYITIKWFLIHNYNYNRSQNEEAKKRKRMFFYSTSTNSQCSPVSFFWTRNVYALYTTGFLDSKRKSDTAWHHTTEKCVNNVNVIRSKWWHVNCRSIFCSPSLKSPYRSRTYKHGKTSRYPEKENTKAGEKRSCTFQNEQTNKRTKSVQSKIPFGHRIVLKVTVDCSTTIDIHPCRTSLLHWRKHFMRYINATLKWNPPFLCTPYVVYMYMRNQCWTTSCNFVVSNYHNSG